MALLYVFAHFSFPGMWRWSIGPLHYSEPLLYPFLDMHGRLAAFEAWQAGFDIWSYRNPLDPLGRVNNKPSWGLAISALGMTRDNLVLAGSLVVVSTVSALIMIIRPKSTIETVFAFLLVCSPSVMLGIERANDDLVYFSILALVPLLLNDGGRVSRIWLAWLLIFLIAPAKFYPGAAFAVFLIRPNSGRLFWKLFAAGAVFIAIYVALFYDEVFRLSSRVPSPKLFMVNGSPILIDFYMQSLWVKLSTFAGVLGLLCVVGRRVISGSEPDIAVWKQRYFMIGFSVYLFCFVLNSNWDYRLLFLLLTVPCLFDMGFRNALGSGWARMARMLLFSLLLIVWVDMGAYHILDALDANKMGMTWLQTVTVVKNVFLAGVVVAYGVLALRLVSPYFNVIFGFLPRLQFLSSKYAINETSENDD